MSVKTRSCELILKMSRPLLSAVLLFGVGASLKLLLLPAYRSTDFEVHRNWMAITSSLPLSQWYTDETSQWTLDYPPLFAWFEWLLAFGARFCDPGMLVVSATPYESAATVAYQRLTVIVTDSLLLAGSFALASARAPKTEPSAWLPATALTFLNAGLLLVDHVHFQYNGMLIGLLLLSTALMDMGHERWAALTFAVLLCLKHLFLFAAPLYFVHLLCGHVLGPQRALSARALGRLVLLGAIVLGVFAIVFTPFIVFGQLAQMAARLFPFGRGLTHAYWAPNAWALYTCADRVVSAAAARLLPASSLAAMRAASPSASSGLVGEIAMLALPSIGGGEAALLVILAQAPVLLGTASSPRRAAFAPAVAFCGLAAFVFGYHVHEKALLPPLLVLTAFSPPAHTAAAALHARILLILSSAGHYALLPLLHAPAEWALSRLLPLAYGCALAASMRCRGLGLAEMGLRWWEQGYLVGLVPLEAFCSFVHPIFLAPRMPFLPLLLTSVYCAIGVLHASWLTFWLWRYCARGGKAAP